MAGKPEKPAAPPPPAKGEKPAAPPPKAEKADKPAKKDKKSKRDGAMKRTFYVVEGGKLERKRNFCPKCGAGVFLANHKDRVSCGHCGYTEFRTPAASAKV